MVKTSLFPLFLLLGFLVHAQTEPENIFLHREFWKTAPSVAQLKEKIEAGNDPVKPNRFAFDAVCYAILENAPLEGIQYLLSLEGNQVDKNTHDGRNYLMWAAYKGNIPLMEHLIKAGSDTKIIDDHGNNVMTFAAVGGQQNPAVYDVMLANGASVKDANRDGATALMLLSPRLKDFAIADYFVGKGLSLLDKDGKGNTMFSYAVSSGNKMVMKKLLELGVDYSAKNTQGENAFMFAARGFRRDTNTLELFTFLDSLGLEANIANTENQTPLHALAFRQKDPKVFQFFIDKGVSVGEVDEKGNTALINATRTNNVEIAKMLQNRTRGINHKNKEGMSALVYAFRNGNTELVDFFLAKDADIKTKDSDGRNVVVHLFDAYSESKQDNFESLLKMALAQGVDPSAAFTKNNNLLHLAVEKTSPYLIGRAMDLNQDINHKNDDGLTPLHLAAMKSKDEKLLKLLLKNGADLNIATDFDESVYDLAEENELLAKNGLDIDFLKPKK